MENVLMENANVNSDLEARTVLNLSALIIVLIMENVSIINASVTKTSSMLIVA